MSNQGNLNLFFFFFGKKENRDRYIYNLIE